MQSVSNAYKEVVSSTSALSPKCKIVIDGVEYLGDVIKTSPKITHSNTSFLGGFPAKTISFDIFNLESNLNLENKEIIAYKGIVVNDSVEWVKQGVFIPQAKDIIHNISAKTITNKINDFTANTVSPAFSITKETANTLYTADAIKPATAGRMV